MKILVAGGTGKLGSDCVEVLGQYHDVKAPDKNELDIVSWDGVIENLQNYTPDFIINCAGFTDVNASETEDFAVRKMGDHFVATTTSPFFLPACLSARDNARSEAPLPYISAVSNQLMPPASEASTT